MVPVLQGRNGAFFIDTQKGVGYDLQNASGWYFEHTLGYDLDGVYGFHGEELALWGDYAP